MMKLKKWMGSLLSTSPSDILHLLSFKSFLFIKFKLFLCIMYRADVASCKYSLLSTLQRDQRENTTYNPRQTTQQTRESYKLHRSTNKQLTQIETSPRKRIKNLTNTEFSHQELKILNKGLKFSPQYLSHNWNN